MEEQQAPFRRIPVSDGTGIYGFFIEIVSLDRDERLVKQHRYFLTQNMICVSVRNRGETRGVWKADTYSSFDRAKEALLMELEIVFSEASSNDGRVVMTDVPVIVELRESDVAKILSGEPPLARNTATLSVESRIGKITDSSDFSLPEGIWERTF